MPVMPPKSCGVICALLLFCHLSSEEKAALDCNVTNFGVGNEC